MPDDPSTATAAQSGATAPEAAAEPAQAAAPQVDYNALLDQVPDHVLRASRRVNGYAGSIAQSLAERERQRIQAEESARAAREKEEQLLQLAQENPFEFSQKYQTEAQQKKLREEIEHLRQKATADVFEGVAQGYQALPEWKNLTPDEFARVQQRVAGLDGPALVAGFNAAALDIIADRRAASRTDQRVRERLQAERQAWEQEQTARRLRGEAPPDMSAPVSANGLSVTQAIRQMSDREFNDWYDKNFKS